MTREEQIIEKGIEYTLNQNPMCLGGDNFAKQVQALNRNYSFEAGAKWADEHPKNIWHQITDVPTKDCFVLLRNKYDQYETIYVEDCDVEFWQWCINHYKIYKWAYITDICPKED